MESYWNPHMTSDEVRKMILKLDLFELDFLHRMLNSHKDNPIFIAAKQVIEGMLPGHKTFLIDYRKKVITAYFGRHHPGDGCRTIVASSGNYMYSRWYSASADPICHEVNWSLYIFKRCTFQEFGDFLYKRLGPNHLTAYQFRSGLSP